MGYLLRAEKFGTLLIETASLHVGSSTLRAYASGGTHDFSDVSSASIDFKPNGNFTKFYIYGVLNTISTSSTVYKSFALTGNSRLYWVSGGASVGNTMYLVRMTYTVSYNTQHGTAPASKSEVSDLTDTELPKLTAEGYIFQGWYYESTFTTQAQVGDPLSADTTLYAKWAIDPDYLIKGTTLTDIADAIRVKTGGTAPLSPADMAEAIEDELVKPSGNKSVTAGTSTQTGIDVSEYATVSVAPTPTESKTATQNGMVTPSSGKFLSSVVVAIPTYDGTVV